jgi:hybrid cluster-associated redox disulfide protein
MRITKNTKALDAIKMSHKIIKVLENHGLYCLTCKGAVEDTIEKIAVNNGMDAKEFLKELNAALE